MMDLEKNAFFLGWWCRLMAENKKQDFRILEPVILLIYNWNIDVTKWEALTVPTLFIETEAVHTKSHASIWSQQPCCDNLDLRGKWNVSLIIMKIYILALGTCNKQNSRASTHTLSRGPTRFSATKLIIQELPYMPTKRIYMLPNSSFVVIFHCVMIMVFHYQQI